MLGEFVLELLLLFRFSEKRTEKNVVLSVDQIFALNSKNLSKSSEPNN